MVTDDSLDDGRLVVRFVSGDASAFEALVARNMRLAGAVAYSVTGDLDAARDVVQESFLKVHAGLTALKEPDAFKGWLRNVVRTTALDWRRRNKKGVQSLDALRGEDSDGLDPAAPTEALNESIEDRDELRRQVREEIARLPESHREVVALKYLDGKSYEEIEALTGLSQATIESRLFRARQKLKTRFERTLARRTGDRNE